MSELITEKLTRWSLKHVEFLLAHMEGFIDDEHNEMRERARHFTVNRDLDKVERLTELHPNDPTLAGHVLTSLAPFFESGALLARGQNPGDSENTWWVTNLICRGNSFHLERGDQLAVKNLVPEMTPLQVHRTPGQPLLSKIGLQFLSPGPHCEAFLLRPTPTVAYLLITNLAPPWLDQHFRLTQELVNNCFLY